MESAETTVGNPKSCQEFSQDRQELDVLDSFIWSFRPLGKKSLGMKKALRKVELEYVFFIIPRFYKLAHQLLNAFCSNLVFRLLNAAACWASLVFLPFGDCVMFVHANFQHRGCVKKYATNLKPLYRQSSHSIRDIVPNVFMMKTTSFVIKRNFIATSDSLEINAEHVFRMEHVSGLVFF